jgi:hypothetical protein
MSLARSSYTVICEHTVAIVCRRVRKNLKDKRFLKDENEGVLSQELFFFSVSSTLLYNPNNLYNDIEYRYCVFC